MKGIKIILGIIITLSLVFFSTGLVVKETVFTARVTINAPIKKVFAKFKDNDNLKQWLPEIKSIDVINKNPQKIGSRYRLLIDANGQEVKMKQKILAYILNEKVTYSFTSDAMIKQEDFTFVANNNTTEVVQKSSIRCSSFMLACAFPWFKSKFQDMSQQNLNRFKTLFN